MQEKNNNKNNDEKVSNTSNTKEENLAETNEKEDEKKEVTPEELIKELEDKFKKWRINCYFPQSDNIPKQYWGKRN